MSEQPFVPDASKLPSHRRGLYEAFEEAGEAYVRDAISTRRYSDVKLIYALQWIREIDAYRLKLETDALSARTSASAEEANDIARAALASSNRMVAISTSSLAAASESNRIAREASVSARSANRAAWAAAIAAIVAAIYTVAKGIH